METSCWYLPWHDEQLLFIWNPSDNNLSVGKARPASQKHQHHGGVLSLLQNKVSVTLHWTFLNTLASSFVGVEDNLVVTSRHFMSPATLDQRTAKRLLLFLWSFGNGQGSLISSHNHGAFDTTECRSDVYLSIVSFWVGWYIFFPTMIHWLFSGRSNCIM